MSAPAPGWMPTTVPSALPRSTGQRYRLVSSHMPEKMLPMRLVTIIGEGSVLTM